ncbi:MAG: ATP-binding protein, partial [Spirochaetaceae bacterium]|nr:ATP-binding protein [Spirochaetaceae bacterium]
MVSVPVSKYRDIERYVHTVYPGDSKLNAALRLFRMVSMESLFVRFPDMAERLAEQIGRRIMPLEVSGGRFPVLPERYEALVGSFVHIIRNMLDHGIEPPAEWELKNKNPEGRLMISIESSDGTVVIDFKDDGRGLSVSEIEKKARVSGLISQGEKPSRAVLYSMIFHHDFSTAGKVTDVSGRGYGLSAVKEEVVFMKAEYANPFINSAKLIFEKEIGIKLSRKELVKLKNPLPSLPVSIVIGVT